MNETQQYNTENVAMDNKTLFLTGLKKAIPILLGYTPLGLAFGVIAKQQGMNLWQTALMSLTAFTGSGQFIAVGMLGAGASITAILLTNILVNLRYLLLSAAMAPYVQKMPTFMQTILAFSLTDETFAINMTEFNHREPNFYFMFGVGLLAHLAWIANSALGVALGNFIPNIDRYGINFALPAMFIALLVMQIKDQQVLKVALLAGGLSVILAFFTKHGTNIIAATILAATVGVILWQRRQKSTSSS